MGAEVNGIVTKKQTIRGRLACFLDSLDAGSLGYYGTKAASVDSPRQRFGKMERDRFIESAPNYYALAIAAYFNSKEETASESMVRSFYSLPGQFGSLEDDEEPISYLSNPTLFGRAIEILVERGFLTEVADDFGPSIYEKMETFDSAWEKADQDTTLPFQRYRLAKWNKSWLIAALSKINSQFMELGVSEADFDSPSHEWEPLPLDRHDANLQAVTSQLDETINQIRADNGYAATFAGERDMVIDSLSGTANRLKNDATISWGYLQKNAFEPLKTVLRRFKGAALGAAVTVMITTFQSWLQGLGVEWLNALWKAFWSAM